MIAAQSPTKRLTSWLAALGVLIALLTVFAPATAAHAACKPAGVPASAGGGVTGAIDPATADPSGGNVYGSYGWAGLRWNTCDLGPLGDPLAGIDTWTGNAFMGLASLEGSIITALHKWSADPSTLFKPLDDKIAQLSEVTIDVLFADWAYPVIMLAGVGILASALTRNVRKAGATVLATMLALGFVAYVGGAPLTVAQATDGVAASIISAADERALQYAGVPDKANGKGHELTANTSEATGAVLNDAIIQPWWRLGQSGSMDWTTKTEKLFTSGTASYSEVKNGFDADKKRDEYNDAVDDVKNDDSIKNQYQTIKGQSYNRAGAGFMAAFSMTSIAWIRLPAEALQFMGLLVMRMVPLIGPIFALLAIPAVTRGAAIAASKTVAASVYNVVVFGVVGVLHTAITAVLFVNTANVVVSIVLSCLITFVMVKLSKPFQSVTKLASGMAVARELEEAPSAAGNAIRGAAGMAAGFMTGMSFDGNKTDKKEGEKINPESATDSQDERDDRDTAGEREDKRSTLTGGFDGDDEPDGPWSSDIDPDGSPDGPHERGADTADPEFSDEQIDVMVADFADKLDDFDPELIFRPDDLPLVMEQSDDENNELANAHETFMPEQAVTVDVAAADIEINSENDSAETFHTAAVESEQNNTVNPEGMS